MIEFAPAVAVKVPPHVVTAFGVGAIVRPEGNVSVSCASNVTATPVVLPNVIVSVLDAFAATVVGANAFPTVGGTGGALATLIVIGVPSM